MNPAGYPWEEQNFVDRRREQELRQQWVAWRGQAVLGSEETVEREQLDAWQGFAYDILERKAQEREQLVLRGGERMAGHDRDEEGGWRRCRYRRMTRCGSF